MKLVMVSLFNFVLYNDSSNSTGWCTHGKQWFPIVWTVTSHLVLLGNVVENRFMSEYPFAQTRRRTNRNRTTADSTESSRRTTRNNITELVGLEGRHGSLQLCCYATVVFYSLCFIKKSNGPSRANRKTTLTTTAGRPSFPILGGETLDEI